ncbi:MULTISPECIES: M20/M25/M40 family metallo-hydrolase [unclassified Streptomyces]|uniref:M20/M25/M40 family metallo-hydrolase n=1 Tax=unclassified Streptomyces TaxID=2593676 RepID=UPI00130152B9|nr:M20/M25/M40 family metallo-hydrolase [Streptomyces sp. CB02058]
MDLLQVRSESPDLPEEPVSRVTPRRAGAVLLLLLAVLAGMTLYTLQPPDAKGSSAPEGEFSAGRALTDVRVLARAPHPIGSPESAAVRGHLIDRLTALGGRAEDETHVVARNGEGTAVVAEVHNVHARFPGKDSTGNVVLVAHYDSVPAGPGAADNAANVAAVLEVVRALRADGTQRNDIDVVLTDGEETGLLGARAFLDSTDLDPERSVVMNLEARGVSGPSIMFEAGDRNSGPVAALGDGDRPIATSMSDEIYCLLPNATDFTEFKDKGFTGLNFAFVDGSAKYHTRDDSVASLSRESVQSQGDVVLAAARGLAGQDLSALSTGKDTYFSLFGLIVQYPQLLVVVLALLAVLGYAATFWYAGRRGAARDGVLRTALTFPLVLVAAGAVAFGVWQLICLFRPGYGSLLSGDTYRPQWFRGAFTALTCALVLGWFLLLRRKAQAAGLALGIGGWLAALTLLTAFLMPGAAYVFTWPLLFGCAGLAAALRWGNASRDWVAVGATAAALPALPLLIPLVVLLFPTLGVSFAAPSLVLLALVAITVVPLAALLPRRVPSVTALVAVAAGVVLVATGLRVDGFGTGHPQPTNLFYAWDADTGKGRWLSADGAPPAWTKARAGTERTDVSKEFPTFPPTLQRGLVADAEAPAVRPAAPEVKVLQDSTAGGDRTVRLRIAPGEGTAYVAVSADTSAHTVKGATVLGAEVDGGRNQTFAPGPWQWGFAAWAVPAAGVEVELRVRGEGAIPLRVTSYREGLPSAGGTETELPPELTWSTWGAFPTNVTAVGRTVKV